MAKQKEKQIENAILEYLAMVPGFEAWNVDTVGIFDPKTGGYRQKKKGPQQKGVSDIIGFYKGKFWAIEVKTPERMYRKDGTERKGAVSPEQKHFIKTAQDNGQIGIVVTSVDEVHSAIIDLTTK
jgi:penicillin-binding protein-related factor A (putative recombinase)